ncbi:unnamed protein product [Arabis nemorensis]|uniref:DUF7903 domain-containing protein n=1 Tax=Arabis nemorensis TaxID=586526 RepID=A0A565BW71_9BRAS|nr:unnamed protein product [Arabis nemorensis]
MKIASSSSVPPSLQNRNICNSKNTKKIYADDCISGWFLVGSEEDNNLKLVPVSSEWRKAGEEKKPLLILAKSDLRNLETPWLWVTEKVKDDLILGFGKAKKTLLRY